MKSENNSNYAGCTIFSEGHLLKPLSFNASSVFLKKSLKNTKLVIHNTTHCVVDIFLSTVKNCLFNALRPLILKGFTIIPFFLQCKKSYPQKKYLFFS